ncbi:hypothetical protein BC351_10595 [Paenibacillus ferrarius]|uniref:Uncharacterized protein n=1 Tax=Paenibacillus ferrarius TaxID=1469647 RepID=A0A1V4H9H1_9BACL|nr:hypothetical protein [Paenibacillus ferrarius]OPH47629.1 hypothetical protein BC351_10595 [Paenibacillus ferrarius]
MENKEFIALIENIIDNKLKELNLLTGQWNLGTVVQVKNAKLLSVYVNGSQTPQDIPCNPDVTFSVGSKVFVLFINGRSTDKYVPFKRGV